VGTKYVHDNISLSSGSKTVQKTKTHFTFNKVYSEYSAFYEIMWKNFEQSDRPQMTISHYAFALHARYLWLQTHTHTM
jgi:hypothetical protein